MILIANNRKLFNLLLKKLTKFVTDLKFTEKAALGTCIMALVVLPCSPLYLYLSFPLDWISLRLGTRWLQWFHTSPRTPQYLKEEEADSASCYSNQLLPSRLSLTTPTLAHGSNLEPTLA